MTKLGLILFTSNLRGDVEKIRNEDEEESKKFRNEDKEDEEEEDEEKGKSKSHLGKHRIDPIVSDHTRSIVSNRFSKDVGPPKILGQNRNAKLGLGAQKQKWNANGNEGPNIGPKI